MTDSSIPQIKAAVYLRISLDREMDGLAIERQREDCMKILEDKGWKLFKEYVDQSKSATNMAKRRPAYDKMVADYGRGLFEAIVCWDLDRLTRQPRQLEDWIDAAESRGLLLVTANGEADLTTDGGRLFARVKSAVARSEVERKGARQHRAHVQRAAMGKPPHGVRPLGYDLKSNVIPEEAEAVRAIYESFCAGASLRAIAAGLSGREGDSIPNVPRMMNQRRKLALERNERRRAEGKAERPVPDEADWNTASVLGILRNPRYAGYSTYTPTEKLKEGNRRKTWHAQIMRDKHNEPVEGTWEPIVSTDLWWAVQEKLNDPARVTNRKGTDRKHLGAGIFLCGVCGKPVRSHGKAYRCEGHIMRSRAQIDAFVVEALKTRLSGKDLATLLRFEDTPEAKEIAGKLEAARARIRQAENDYDEGIIESTDLKRVRDKKRAEIEELEKQRLRLVGNASLDPILTADDPAGAFDSSDLARRRSIIEALCTVTLFPHPRGIKAFDGSDVKIKWKSE